MLEPTSLSQDQRPLNYSIEGTILEVELTSLLSFRIPVQHLIWFLRVRCQSKSGGQVEITRKVLIIPWPNGILRLSEYDEQGWHPNPYVAREFYGVWGKL